MHLEGAFILADLHHEIGCPGRPDHGGHRENLVTADELAQALDDEHQAAKVAGA